MNMRIVYVALLLASSVACGSSSPATPTPPTTPTTVGIHRRLDRLGFINLDDDGVFAESGCRSGRGHRDLDQQ